MLKIKTLKNNVRIVAEDLPYVESIAIGVWVKAGAVNEEAKFSGISHFVEHMMFKGTENRSAKEIAEEIDKIGGQINAFTGKEATCYYVKALHNNYHKAVDVIIDMLTNSTLETKEMNKERKVICEEIKMTQDTPDDLVHETIVEQIFKGCPLGKSIIGTPTSLSRITHNVMKKYMDKEYTRDNMVISVVGRFDFDEVCSYFEEKFMELNANKNEIDETPAEYTPSYKSITRDINQTHISLGTRAFGIRDDRYFALSILNNIMGGSMSSRLFQNIREEKGLAYSVYSMLSAFSKDGYFNIYAGISHDKIKDVVDGIQYELEFLNKQGITKDELNSSKEQLKASYVFGLESVAGRMFKNGKNITLFGDIISPEDVLKGYDSVSMDQIEEVKKLICDFSSYSAAVVSNKKVNLRSIMGV